LEKQAKESERIDREKTERKDMEREETRKKAENAIRLAREESKELENLRRRRELRVPWEPGAWKSKPKIQDEFHYERGL